MEIRKLKNGDIFRVVAMLRKVGGNAAELTKLISSAKKNKKEQKNTAEAVAVTDNDSESAEVFVAVGTKVLMACYDAVSEDFINWMADLAGVSRAEFDDLPPTTTLEIIDQLVTGEDARHFFTTAWQLFNKIRQSGSGIKRS